VKTITVATKAFDNSDSDAKKLTMRLLDAGATKLRVIEIINSFGDEIDWGHSSLVDIIGNVWDSDCNSGDLSGSWIINEICRAFNVEEVTE